MWVSDVKHSEKKPNYILDRHKYYSTRSYGSHICRWRRCRLRDQRAVRSHCRMFHWCHCPQAGSACDEARDSRPPRDASATESHTTLVVASPAESVCSIVLLCTNVDFELSINFSRVGTNIQIIQSLSIRIRIGLILVTIRQVFELFEYKNTRIFWNGLQKICNRVYTNIHEKNIWRKNIYKIKFLIPVYLVMNAQALFIYNALSGRHKYWAQHEYSARQWIDKAPDSQWIYAGSKLERRKYSGFTLN